MNLAQLIEILQEIADTTSPDRPVHIAIQPNYPLALCLSGVCDGAGVAADDPEDDDLDPEVSEAVFILAEDRHPNGLAYVSPALWKHQF